MYIPLVNQLTDLTEIMDFIQRFSFGTIVSFEDGKPIATHLPFVSFQRENQIILQAHFAKANEQWKYVEEQDNLIIFQEPHAYISPSHYEKEQNVPTWNYISVHLYGRARIVVKPEETLEFLESSIEYFDSAYRKQWNTLSDSYKSNMIQGVVAFEIIVSNIQAKKKISQNRSEKERGQIAKALSQSSNTSEKLIADYMMKNLERKSK
ncbi:FMN-binding negative transcriptional regulator [Aquirufa sp. OSTEICH-129A]